MIKTIVFSVSNAKAATARLQAAVCLALCLLISIATAPASAQAPPSSVSITGYCTGSSSPYSCTSTQFSTWIAQGLGSSPKPLYAPAGVYNISGSVTVDFNPGSPPTTDPTIGLSIFCDGPQLTQFVFSSGSGITFENSAGTNATTGNAPVYYLWIQGCGFTGSTNAPLVQIGQSDFFDAFNETQLVNDVIRNRMGGTNGGSAIGLQLNYVLNSFVNVTINAACVATSVLTVSGCPSTGISGTASTGYSGLGFAALDCRKCLFNSFFGSYSNSGSGVVLRDDSNYGNVFHSIDDEGTTAAIWTVNGSGTYIHNNTFMGGTFAFSSLGINATVGATTYLFNPYFLGNGTDYTSSVGVTTY